MVRPASAERGAQRARGVLVVDDRAKRHAREGLGQPQQPADGGPDGLIGQQHVGEAFSGEHLGLGNRRALDAREPERDVHPRDLGQLVRLHVRPQPRRAARNRDQAPQILFGAIGIHEQRRRGNLVDVLDASTSQSRVTLRPRACGTRALATLGTRRSFAHCGTPALHQHQARYCVSSNIPSISTAMSCGSDAMPTALRAPTPLVGPQISANSSEQPLMTLG